MKTCSKCLEEKEYSEFYKSKNTKSGLGSWCKPCYSSKHKERSNDESYTDGRKEYRLINYYGLTQQQYNELLVGQGGGCAMCGKSPEENGRALAVDHDHSCCPGKKTCGKCVRGLLCSNHNAMLGYANDDTNILRRAINYLNHHKPDNI